MHTALSEQPVRAWLRLAGALLVLLLLSGCPHLQLIAEYDAKNFEETIRVGKSVDVFYGRMLEMPDGQRPYAKFADQYVEIEADIRSLVRRNAARQLNDESTAISQTILRFWIQYRKKHETNSSRYSDARLDRLRFNRLFTAAASAEAAKKLTAEDRKPEASDED